MSNDAPKMEVVYKDINENELRLTPGIVRKYLTENPNVTDHEVAMFMKLCELQQLNPFIREVYLVKYGTSRATFVTGKETFLKRAAHHPKYRGHKAWCDGEGDSMTATAEVYVEGYTVPITCTVDYEEYVGKKGDGSPNAMWATKPKTMLRKVALVQALREAFPDTFGGMYSQEEISTIDVESLPTGTVSTKAEDVEVSGPVYKEKAAPAKQDEKAAEKPVEDETAGEAARDANEKQNASDGAPMSESLKKSIRSAFAAKSNLLDEEWFVQMVPEPKEKDRDDFVTLYNAINGGAISASDVSRCEDLYEALRLIK